MQDTKDTEPSTDEVQSTSEYKKKSLWGGYIFRTRPDWPRGPPRLLYSVYRLCVPGVEPLARGIYRPDAKEKVRALSLFPSRPSWLILAV